MDKKYQVFVSSTFADLQEERRKVVQTVMELDCFPAGMELFPAADEEQWEFIQRVIDDCDYYLLIIGGRYGSLTTEGISYTEKEYEYAVARGIPVLAFLHEKPEEISVGKSDLDPSAREKLELFREKVSQGRLVKSWSRADELPGLVALSLSKAMKTHPATGWIRASGVPSSETLAEMNELRKQIAQLQVELAKARRAAAATPLLDNLAPLDSKVTIRGRYFESGIRRTWSIALTWLELFSLIAPELLDTPNDSTARSRLLSLLFKRTKRSGTTPTLEDEDFDTVKVQFMAQRLITVENLKTVKGGMGLFWQLTANGRRLMLESRAVRAERDDAVEGA